MKKFTILFLLGFLSSFVFSQEVAPERIVDYNISLNKIKTQDQVNQIEAEIKLIEHVQSSKLDWENYSLKIKVQEGGENPSFNMEKLKAILEKNNATLTTFTKEIKRNDQ